MPARSRRTGRLRPTERRTTSTTCTSSTSSDAPPRRSPVADTLAALASCFASLGIDWYLFGAQAALLRGSRRLTSDVDVTVFLGQVGTAELVDRMTATGFVLRVPRTGGFIERTHVVPFIHA